MVTLVEAKCVLFKPFTRIPWPTSRLLTIGHRQIKPQIILVLQRGKPYTAYNQSSGGNFNSWSPWRVC
jgi:hypothetical protein